MVELEGKVSGATQEDKGVEIKDRVVEMITEGFVPENDQRNNEERGIYACA